MDGYITEGSGWMQHQLHAECYPKPKRIYFSNHNNSYIKHDAAFVPVRFNYNAFDADGKIPMCLNSDGVWVMTDSTDPTAPTRPRERRKPMDNKKEKLIRVEDALLNAITRVCEGYPSNLGRNSDGEFLMACAKLLSVLSEKERAL